jgi:hypothetical protein
MGLNIIEKLKKCNIVTEFFTNLEREKPSAKSILFENGNYASTSNNS